MAISRSWFNRIPSVRDSRSRDGDGRVDQVADLDIMLAQVDDGGLLSGLCRAAQALLPRMVIFACEPAGALDAMESVKQNRIVPMPNPDSACRWPLNESWGADPPDFLSARDGVLCCCRGEILLAMQFAYERLKLMIEPSSVVALVPLLRQEPQLVSKRVGVVLTGGNVELLRPWPRLDGTETMQR